MAVDTIVYEKKAGRTRIAGLKGGDLREVEIIDAGKAGEGNIYLGRITNKIDLANGKIGFFVNIGDSREAFINAEEPGLEELNATIGQDIIVQVAQEQRAEKGARLVRGIQLVGENLVYCPYRMTVEASGKIEDKTRADECRELVLENTTGQEGWIIRTAAVNCPPETLVKEMEDLRGKFNQLRSAAEKTRLRPCCWPSLTRCSNICIKTAVPSAKWRLIHGRCRKKSAPSSGIIWLLKLRRSLLPTTGWTRRLPQRWSGRCA